MLMFGCNKAITYLTLLYIMSVRQDNCSHDVVNNDNVGTHVGINDNASREDSNNDHTDYDLKKDNASNDVGKRQCWLRRRKQ